MSDIPPTKDHTMTLYDARLLAPTWLSIAVASGKDAARPALDRTVSIEAFPQGLRVTATDSYLLLTGWVPNTEHEFDDPPELDEAPESTAVAMDPHGRARGLLAHALGLANAAAKADDPTPIELEVRLGVLEEDEGEQRTTFEGMDPTWVVLELPDHERVKLRTYEGEFPSWRSFLISHTAVRTSAIALAPDRVDRLGKLGKYHAGAALRFTFGGQNKGVHLAVDESTVEGLVMPVRWDFDADSPRDDTPDPDDAA